MPPGSTLFYKTERERRPAPSRVAVIEANLVLWPDQTVYMADSLLSKRVTIHVLLSAFKNAQLASLPGALP
jgi:hypothetical protein